MSSKEAIAPKLGDKVVAQVAASPVVPLEYEILYPSSDLTASERLELDVRYDGERVKHSMPSAVQLVVKALAVLRDRKTKNDRKQKDNARVGDGPNTSYSPLTEADTFMKSVRQARRVGDSRFTGGLLWRISGLASQSQIAPATSAGGSINTTAVLRWTRVNQQQEPLKPIIAAQQEDKREERPEGWLWHLGKIGKLSQSEMDTWSNEGDVGI
ncbi:hypothetical protein B0H13DRAFT_1927556 [Mycena leptocephala]|nr:hypothetical protein B0H13DRAFT_1927556 [Mycena leptocephala]